MPSPLPTPWTADSSLNSRIGNGGSSYAAPFLQAFSFFMVVLLGSAWAVKALWNVLRKDLPVLPALSYRRSLCFVILWGLLAIIVLTMISGARELMTPGAWRKQGWTYKLNDAAEAAPSSQDERRQALEALRLLLWQYAATHNGQFPILTEGAIEKKAWEIPGWPGLNFLYVEGQTADEAGRLLVHEPELDGESRQVLLTNGMIGEMRTAEIAHALKKARQR
jgi:hypothetical protein